MRTKKMIIFLPLLLAMMLGLTGCSSDDEETISLDNQVDVTFRLCNVKMQNSAVFEEGDDIIFELSIINNSVNPMVFHRNFEGDSDFRVDENLFRVYSESGKDYGTPWQYMFLEKSLQNTWEVPAKSLFQLSSPWYGQSSSRFIYTNGKLNPKLEKGNYYTKFSVWYNTFSGSTKGIMQKKNFLVQFKIL